MKMWWSAPWWTRKRETRKPLFQTHVVLQGFIGGFPNTNCPPLGQRGLMWLQELYFPSFLPYLIWHTGWIIWHPMSCGHASKNYNHTTNRTSFLANGGEYVWMSAFVWVISHACMNICVYVLSGKSYAFKIYGDKGAEDNFDTTPSTFISTKLNIYISTCVISSMYNQLF